MINNMETPFLSVSQLLKLTKQPIEIHSECFSFETLMQIANLIAAEERNINLVVGKNLSYLQLELLIKASRDHFILKL